MVFAVLGSLGGVVAFCGAMWVVVRAVFKNINAVEDNTDAVKKLTERLDKHDDLFVSQGERIARLEGRNRAHP